MFWTRFATSAVFAPIALGAVYFGFPVFEILIAAMAVAVMWEYVQISGKAGFPPRAVVGAWVVIAAVGLAISNFQLAFIVIFVAAVLLFLTDKSGKRNGLSTIHGALLYAGIPAMCLVIVRETGDAGTVFWLLAVVWATDIGAYAAGRLIGGPKLAPSISPNKTWSGAFGGLAAALLAGGLVGVVFGATPSLLNLLLAVGICCFSQVGDLVESWFKRRHNVKDSGTLVPGHGGVMDRVDGLWAAAPIVAIVCAVRDGGVAAW